MCECEERNQNCATCLVSIHTNALLGVTVLLVSYIQNGHWLKVMEGMDRIHLVHDKKSVAVNCEHGTKPLGSSR